MIGIASAFWAACVRELCNLWAYPWAILLAATAARRQP